MVPEGFPKPFPGTAGGHHPGDLTLLLGGLEPGKKSGGKGSERILVGEGPVEVGADEQRFQWGKFSS
jgi:hypothetical protein